MEKALLPRDPPITDDDRDRYRGVGQHPQGRDWLRRRYRDAVHSGDRRQINAVAAELRAAGMEPNEQ